MSCLSFIGGRSSPRQVEILPRQRSACQRRVRQQSDVPVSGRASLQHAALEVVPLQQVVRVLNGDRAQVREAQHLCGKKKRGGPVRGFVGKTKMTNLGCKNNTYSFMCNNYYMMYTYEYIKSWL